VATGASRQIVFFGTLIGRQFEDIHLLHTFDRIKIQVAYLKNRIVSEFIQLHFFWQSGRHRVRFPLCK